MNLKVLFSFLLLLTCNTAYCSKILVVFPLTDGSHYILGNGVVRVLLEAGHDVTFVAPKEEKDPPKGGGKLTQVLLTSVLDDMKKMRSGNNMFTSTVPLFATVAGMAKSGGHILRSILGHPNMQALLKSDEKFDAVIVEQLFVDGLKVLAHHFNAPLIVVSSIGPNIFVNRFVGNPSPSSYIPEMFLSYSSDMTFFERMKNSLFRLYIEIVHQFSAFPIQNEIVQEFFPDAPHLDNILFNTSLVFLNSHPSISQPKPQVPAMVEIGGYHIPPPKKLPQDLQEYLDNSKNGVIYFSLGSVVKTSSMPAEMKNIIVSALSKLKQNVLWKWEDDELPGRPKNVKTGKWLPQIDILAHPNVKLFITHGGLLSTIETIYHAKPILAIPIVGDQQINAAEAVSNGYAISLLFKELTEEKLVNGVNELLSNPKYSENVQKRSKIFYDRPQTPQQTLTYWTEYVIRHKGAAHLRVAALDLAWYQYLLLDVFAFLTVSFVVALILLKCAVKGLCRRRKQNKKTKIN